jgi:chemotaxis protein methyltransferase CheR
MQNEIYQKFGYDFSQYNLKEIDCKGEVTIDFVDTLWNHTSYFFRNPSVFHSLQSLVFPYLQTLPAIQIWCAGCAQGEEVYSLAILLKEAGLLEKSQIYATDISAKSLAKAQQASYLLPNLVQLEEDYTKAGGKYNFEDYIKVQTHHFKMQAFAKPYIQFIEHDLLKPSIFQNIDLILCRNVLIYFKLPAYKAILQALYESLAPQGFMCLGAVDTVLHHDITVWETFNRHSNIFRKKDMLV